MTMVFNFFKHNKVSNNLTILKFKDLKVLNNSSKKIKIVNNGIYCLFNSIIKTSSKLEGFEIYSKDATKISISVIISKIFHVNNLIL